MHLTPEEALKLETENVEMLTSMMGGGDPEITRRVLRKYNGNMEKAADAILSGETGEEAAVWVAEHAIGGQLQSNNAPGEGVSAPHGTPQASVIDLTGDNDEEFSRALQMSMEDNSQKQDIKFGPSDRAPDPAWQMVPSNVPVGQQAPAVSQEDQNLNDAIKASLDDFAGEDAEDYPPPNAVRVDGKPLALRADTPSLAYAAQIVNALYFVPQIRAAIAKLRLPDANPALPHHAAERAIWNLVEMFCHMDLANLAVICDNELLSSLEATPCAEPGEAMMEASLNFLKRLGHMVEAYINADKIEESRSDCRLFTFIHGSVEFAPGRPRQVKTDQRPGDVVTVDVGGPDNLQNDIISSLVKNLSQYGDSRSVHEVIVEPSDFVAFWLKRSTTTQSGVKVSPEPFIYPKSIYLDQFLLHNVETVVRKRAKERDIMRDVKKLKAHRETLTQLDNRNTLKDLQSSIDYLEYIADPGDDPARKEQLKGTAEKLKAILSTATGKVEEIDRDIESLTNECAELFDCPELQKHRYDLRAVLVHTGLAGRKQMYSYVHDGKGGWWKIQDYTVTEVPEEVVLTDSTALHLNAGPYVVFYSRHLEPHEMEDTLPWPEFFANMVNENNQTLLSQWETLPTGSADPPDYIGAMDLQRISSPNVMDLSVD